MRFEHGAAYAMGVALPALEIARRRTDFEPLAAYVDDLVVGALLLVAARAVSRGARHGPALLAGAWGVLCGGLYGSFFGQLRATDPTDVSGLPNAVVVAIKGALFAVAIAAFVLSVRRAADAG